MRLTQQMASALFFIAFGGLYFWLATDLAMGTAADMGPGYMPRALAIGCIGVGLILLAIALAGRGLQGPVTGDMRAVSLTTAMVGGFALALPWLGLPLTVILAVMPVVVSGERYNMPVLIAIAVGLALFTTVLFALGLKLQIPIAPAIPGLRLPGLR